jgi:hypothetical protein
MNSCHVFWHLAHASETRTCIYFRYCFVSYTIYVFRGTMFITITKTVVSYHRILTSVIGCTSGRICFAYMNSMCIVFSTAPAYLIRSVSAGVRQRVDIWNSHTYLFHILVRELYHKRVPWNNVYKKKQLFLSQDTGIHHWLHFWAYLFRIHELNVHCVFHRAGVFNTFCVSGCPTVCMLTYWHIWHVSYHLWRCVL